MGVPEYAAVSKPRIVIADDHTLLVEAFEKLLSPECDVVAKVATAARSSPPSQEFHPDVVVLDMAMPLLNGLDAGRQIKQKHPSRPAGLRDDERGSRPRRRGVPRPAASAYLLKRSAGAELLTAIREAMKGRSYVTPLVTEGMLGLADVVRDARRRTS